MGSKYGSIHARTDDIELVSRIVEEALSDDLVAVDPAEAGWVSLYPEDFLRTEDVATAVARAFTGRIAAFSLYDDDVFRYWLYEEGLLVDEFDSSPDYFGDAEPAYKTRTRGTPTVLGRFLGVSEHEAARLLSNRTTNDDFDPGYRESFARTQAAMRAARDPIEFKKAIEMLERKMPKPPDFQALRSMPPEKRREAMAQFMEASNAVFFGADKAARDKLHAEPLLLAVASGMGISRARARGFTDPGEDAGRRRLPRRLIEARDARRTQRQMSYRAECERQRDAGERLWDRESPGRLIGFDEQGRLWLESDGATLILDSADGKELARRPATTLLARVIGDDRRHLAGTTPDRTALEVQRLDDDAIVLTVPLPAEARGRVAWSIAPDGRLIAVETTQRLAFVDITTGATLHAIDGPRQPGRWPGCWSRDGRHFVVAQMRPESRQWSFELLLRDDWTRVGGMTLGDPRSWFATNIQQMGLATTPGLLLAASSHGVLVIDLSGKCPVRALTSKVSARIETAVRVEETAMGLALDDGERMLAALGADGVLRFWSLPELALLAGYDARPFTADEEDSVKARRSTILMLAADASGQRLVTWGRQAPFVCWKAPSVMSANR